MVQERALQVYAYVEAWWGERLTPDLARIISEAPAAHLRRFAADWPDNSWFYRSGHLERLKGAQLRPVYGQRNVSDEQSVATRMLLYVPATVLDANLLDPLAPIEWRGINLESRAAIRSLLTWLAESRPLVEDGSILYTGKVRGMHPSVYPQFAWRKSHREDWANTELEGLPDGELAEAISELNYRLAGNMLVVREGTGNVLALTPAEEALYKNVLGEVPISDEQVSHLTTLSRLQVPDFRGSISTLVNLRANADVFHEWRTALSGALRRVGDVPSDDKGADAAVDILRAELEDSLTHIKQETEKSPALRALALGGKGLILTGIGASAGAAVTTGLGNPAVCALVGAASGAAIKTSEGILSYFAGLKERSKAKAIWDVMLSFRDLDGTAN